MEPTLLPEQALAFYRCPTDYPELRNPRRALRGDAVTILQLALGAEPVSVGAPVGIADADEWQAAARFFIEQVLLAPGADYYRVNGLPRGAPEDDVRDNHRLLMRLLHPDRSNLDEAWQAAAAARANRAYATLRDPLTRAAYNQEIALERLARAQQEALEPRRTMRVGPRLASDDAHGQGDTPNRRRAWRLVPNILLGAVLGVALVWVGWLWMERERAELLSGFDATWKSTPGPVASVSEAPTPKAEPVTPPVEPPPSPPPTPVVEVPPAPPPAPQLESLPPPAPALKVEPPPPSVPKVVRAEPPPAPKVAPTPPSFAPIVERTAPLPPKPVAPPITSPVAPPISSPVAPPRSVPPSAPASAPKAEPPAPPSPPPAPPSPPPAPKVEPPPPPVPKVEPPPPPPAPAPPPPLPAPVAIAAPSVAPVIVSPPAPARPAVAAAAPAPRAPDPATLIPQLTQRYARGDLDGFMALFDAAARNETGGRAKIRSDYAELFSSTASRNLAVSGVNWTERNGTWNGEGRFQVTVQRRDESTVHRLTGVIRFEVVADGTRPLIRAIFHQVTGQSVEER